MAHLVTEDELKLAEKLRTLCYVSGREKNPKESAKIIHQLGLHYKERCPDKVSMIRSAALLNAAIVRKPDNESHIINDLRSLCSKILLEAKADNPAEDLIATAEIIKREVTEMRKEAKERLEAVKPIDINLQGEELLQKEERKIEQIKSIQEQIADKYTAIMFQTSQSCQNILGNPPHEARFALVGMGSLARKEISPYSDFENIIVLDEETKQLSTENYDEVVEYFRWYAVVFQVILINFGETVIPSVAIPSLNSFDKPNKSWFYDAFTKCAISFDGMMPFASKTPLGRQDFTDEKKWTTELIKPVSDMLKYLTVEEDLKNGYNLADILTKTCFVSGYRAVYDDFHNGVLTTMANQRNQPQEFLEQLEKQVENDRIKFNIHNKLQPMYTKNFNIKAVMYRSVTIFLSALGKIYGLDATSSFDIITMLKNQGVINDEDRHKLSFAVAVGCEIRLKVYMAKECQYNLLDIKFFLDEGYMKIIKVVGGRSVVDYITIAQQFQKSLLPLKIGSVDGRLHFHWHEDLETTAVLAYILHLPSLMFVTCKKFLREMVENKDTSYEKFYLALVAIRLLDFFGTERQFIHEMEKELESRKQFAADLNDANEDVAYTIYKTGFILKVARKFDEAEVQFRQQLNILNKTSQDTDTDFRVASSHYNIGMCLKGQEKYRESKQYLQTALDIRKKISQWEETDFDVAYNLYQLAQSERYDSQFAIAHGRFVEALSIFKLLSENEAIDVYVQACDEEISLCVKQSTSQASIVAKTIQNY